LSTTKGSGPNLSQAGSQLKDILTVLLDIKASNQQIRDLLQAKASPGIPVAQNLPLLGGMDAPPVEEDIPHPTDADMPSDQAEIDEQVPF